MKAVKISIEDLKVGGYFWYGKIHNKSYHHN